MVNQAIKNAALLGRRNSGGECLATYVQVLGSARAEEGTFGRVARAEAILLDNAGRTRRAEVARMSTLLRCFPVLQLQSRTGFFPSYRGTLV